MVHDFDMLNSPFFADSIRAVVPSIKYHTFARAPCLTSSSTAFSESELENLFKN